MKPGKQSDIVKEFGVSRNAISLLVKNKDYRIIYTPNGKINIDATIKALSDSGFGERSRKLKRKKTAKPKQQPITTEEFESDVEESGELKLTDSRARISKHKEFHQSEKERINNKKTLEKLIDVVEVGDNSFNLWRQVRDEIQGLKDRIAIKTHIAESDHEAEQIVHDETHRILSSIVEGYEDLDDEGLKKKLLQRLIK